MINYPEFHELETNGCKHDWENHIKTPYKDVYLSKCKKCEQTYKYEQDYT
jgi:hypothetical protein